MGPTTHAAYPRVETDQSARYMEAFSLTKFLEGQHIRAFVEVREDGRMHVTVFECLDAECTNIRLLVQQVLQIADPVRVREGKVDIDVQPDVQAAA